MKKLLILALFFGMTSAASATLSMTAPAQLDWSIGQVGTIEISSDSVLDDGVYLDIYYVSAGSYALSNSRLTAIAPTLSGQLLYPGASDNDEVEALFASAPGENVTTGVWYQIDIECLGPGDVLLELYSSGAGYPLLQTLTIAQVPEPMTIALLGLGGLFMLRRRK